MPAVKHASEAPGIARPVSAGIRRQRTGGRKHRKLTLALEQGEIDPRC